ncbi:helix-turn-helix domain-containing protein [Halosquirtibacter xylanolyticus]|uniref:helix-turn-helix domain-containing protein n=1 Tax=Halosquirtibacter xylanolyticus TaxID=3374599 RepID=UPI003747BDEC|nr:helix-turn-helix domain-containing protein [Prolixibacteraceae bacterium]
MTFLEHKEKLEHLLELVTKGRCFALQDVAEKFQCSRRTVKRMLSQLRHEGHNISYCPSSKRFYLE